MQDSWAAFASTRLGQQFKRGEPARKSKRKHVLAEIYGEAMEEGKALMQENERLVAENEWLEEENERLTRKNDSLYLVRQERKQLEEDRAKLELGRGQVGTICGAPRGRRGRARKPIGHLKEIHPPTAVGLGRLAARGGYGTRWTEAARAGSAALKTSANTFVGWCQRHTLGWDRLLTEPPAPNPLDDTPEPPPAPPITPQAKPQEAPQADPKVPVSELSDDELVRLAEQSLRGNVDAVREMRVRGARTRAKRRGLRFKVQRTGRR